MPASLEICVDTFDCAVAANAAGAARLELCAALALGGLTPSVGLMQAAAVLPVPVYAMIRPRDGGFVYSKGELDIMKADIRAAKAAGMDGVVFGVLNGDNTLNLAANADLIAVAAGMKCTLHRAFDEVVDPLQTLEQAIDLGFERILTSGQKPTAVEGLDLLGKLVQAAKGRISIMPGAGVNAGNVVQILRKTEAVEIHGSCSKAIKGFGMFDSAPRRVVSAAKITEILGLIA